MICRNLDLFSKAMVAIDGSKFKGVNSKQRNDTKASRKRRIERTEKNIQTYMDALDAKDKDEPHSDPSEVTRLADKLDHPLVGFLSNSSSKNAQPSVPSPRSSSAIPSLRCSRRASNLR